MSEVGLTAKYSIRVANPLPNFMDLFAYPGFILLMFIQNGYYLFTSLFGTLNLSTLRNHLALLTVKQK